MPWSTPLEADIVLMLTRADYDRSRKKFYAVTGLARNDQTFPKLAPPGAIMVQGETGDPVDDIATDPNAWMEAPVLPVPEMMRAVVAFSRARARALVGAYDRAVRAAIAKYPDLAGLRLNLSKPYSEPMIRLATELARSLRIVVSWDGTALFPEYDWARTDSAGATKDPVATERAAYDALRAAIEGRSPTPTGPAGVAGARAAGAPALPPPISGRTWTARRVARPEALHNAGGHPIVPKSPMTIALFDDWWYGTAWGQERIPWTPPVARNLYSWDAPAAYTLPPDSLVLVRYPHPYVIGLPAPAIAANFSTYPVGAGLFGLYPSRVVVMAPGDRHEPRAYDVIDATGASQQAWAGYYEDARRTDFLDDVVSWVSRTAAVQMLLVGAAAVLTGGAGGAAVASALTGAGAAGAVGAVGAVGPLSAAGIALSSSEAALAGAAISAAAPDQVNAALVEVAEQAPYLDLVPYVGELMDLTFQELTIRAHVVRQEQDRLRLELARARQEIVSQQWFGIAKQAIKAVASTVIAIASMGASATADIGVEALASAVKALTEVVISAATMQVKLLQAREIADAAAREVRQRGDQRIAEIDSEGAVLLAEADDLIRQIEALEREIAEAAAAGIGAGSAEDAPGAVGAAPAPGAGGGIAAWLNGVVGALSTGQKVAGGLALAAGAALALTPKKKARGQN